MTRLGKSLGWVLIGLVQCGQPGVQDGDAGSPAISLATETPEPAKKEDDAKKEDFFWGSAADEVPREKFTDGARSFAKVRDSLLANYYQDGLTEDDLYRAATAGMLEKLDPKMKAWNKLITQREMTELNNDLKGELVGIGVIIRFDAPSGYADVLGALPGSPAEKAGIVVGDKIVTVNGKLYKGMSLRDVVYDIRGKAGETLALSVLHADQLLKLNVVREKVAYDQVERGVLPGNVGYLAIPSFNEKTPARVREHLNDLASKGITSLVLDLRKNGGGLFDHAVETTGLFLKEGTGVVNLQRKGKVVEKLTAKAGGVLLDLPLAVLVDEGTASGAEFMTAALSEGRRAKVVGKKTHGKWSAQRIDQLENGYAVKYTVSLFKSPSDKSFEGVGLRPDIEIAMEETDFGRAQAKKTLEERLPVDAILRTGVEIVHR
jgi:carboxyl-terminal processing protease